MGNLSTRLGLWYRAWRYRMRVERGSVRYVREHLRPGTTAIDIGAHKGAYTYWLRQRVGPAGQVIAFEPQCELAAYLELASSALGWKNVSVVNAAVTERTSTITISRATSRPSPGAKVIDKSATAVGDTFQVPAVSLDDYVRHFSSRPIHFIKCDAEGHELEVFRGARRVLEQDRPILLFECERRHHAGQSIEPVFHFLTSLGYEGEFIRRDTVHPICQLQEAYQSDPDSPDYVNNFVFTHQRRAATSAA